jgi:hypothetical protein
MKVTALDIKEGNKVAARESLMIKKINLSKG